MNWHEGAQCADKNPDDYVLDAGPGEVPASQRKATAKALCAGCGVMVECRADAVEFGDWGVVRAGLWVGRQPSRPLTLAGGRAA